jgi:hypothetical protein
MKFDVVVLGSSIELAPVRRLPVNAICPTGNSVTIVPTIFWTAIRGQAFPKTVRLSRLRTQLIVLTPLNPYGSPHCRGITGIKAAMYEGAGNEFFPG